MATRETSPNSGDSYRPGDYWLICDSCGLKFRRSEMRMRWDKLMVCRKDFELRNAQEFVKGIKEKIAVDIARPDTDPVYINQKRITSSGDMRITSSGQPRSVPDA